MSGSRILFFSRNLAKRFLNYTKRIYNSNTSEEFSCFFQHFIGASFIQVFISKSCCHIFFTAFLGILPIVKEVGFGPNIICSSKIFFLHLFHINILKQGLIFFFIWYMFRLLYSKRSSTSKSSSLYAIN